jgi:VWFA-related protein
MKRSRNYLLLCFVLFCWLAAFVSHAQGQSSTAPSQPAQQPPTKPADQAAFRISTVLVQTDVSVFDKQGKFVDGLPREAFELKVDGQPQPVALFQRVRAGSAEEEANLAAARGKGKSDTVTTANPLTRGQSVIFFVDDYHLEAEHIQRAQQIINSYIARELRAGDRMMIASSSGQLGFLQQFSDNGDVLRAAAARLKYQLATKADVDRPLISLYEAIAVSRNRPDVIEYLVQQYRTQSAYFKSPNNIVQQLIRQRANNIIEFNKLITSAMFSTFENLLRGVAEVPGRKLLFFISAGFILDPALDSSLPAKLNRLLDSAARAGVVCYTVDARGLSVALPEMGDLLSSGASAEPSGNHGAIDANTVAHSEAILTQQALRTLAYDTGGRPILNTNALEKHVAGVVQEYQNYYVLAWEPETVDQDKPKFRKLEISIKGRPELQVRVRRGFFESPPPPEKPAAEKKAESKAETKAAPPDPLTAATRELYPRRELPLTLYAAFKHEPGVGSVISASVEIPTDAVAEIGGKGELEILCVAVDAQGKAVRNEGQKLSFARPTAAAPALVANFRLPLNQGIYQVRAVARDPRNGRVGAEYQWLEIPNFTPGKLALSSLFISEKKATAEAASDESALNTTRRFARSSKLLLQLYLYNAALSPQTKQPDLTLEIQVLRQTQSVLSAPTHAVALTNTNDLARIPYAAEIPLRGLAPGVYTLQITATDRVKKLSEIQSITFVVE